MPQASDGAPTTVGARLRQARERMGLSRADIAARTRIAERHLATIEGERFAELASGTYAVGFSRAYARSVGLDEREIAQAVRGELDLLEDDGGRPPPTFEPGDPARVPNVRTAWLAGLGALAVVVALVAFWGDFLSPAISLPDLTSDKPSATARRAPAATPPTPIAQGPIAQGPVAITARQAGVWVKITDIAGKQLFQKEMKQGETYAIPPDAAEPQLRTAWPDALAITVGGRAVPPLSNEREVLTAQVSATALLARGRPAPPALAAPVGADTPPQRPALPRATARPNRTEARANGASPAPGTSPAVQPPGPAAEPAKASTVSD